MDATVTGGKEAKPLTERNHATTDAVFIGGIVSGDYTVPGSIPDTAHVIAKEDGDTTVAEFKADSIDMKSVNMNITLEGDMKVTTGGKIYLN